MNNIIITGNASPEEAKNYINYLEEKYDRKVKKININLDGEFADLTYEFADVPFERIRRITGYLVGTMDKWNDAKTAEEADRVKHSISCDVDDLATDIQRKDYY